MKSKGQKRHDNLVFTLEECLEETEEYDKIKLFFDYCRNGQIGEVDLLAISEQIGFNSPSIFDFYEVKSSYSNKTRRKAEEQFSRFKLAFPRNVRDGYMFWGKGLLRL